MIWALGAPKLENLGVSSAVPGRRGAEACLYRHTFCKPYFASSARGARRCEVDRRLAVEARVMLDEKVDPNDGIGTRV